MDYVTLTHDVDCCHQHSSIQSLTAVMTVFMSLVFTVPAASSDHLQQCGLVCMLELVQQKRVGMQAE